MADLAVTAAQVAPVYPDSPETIIETKTLLVAATAGQSIYTDPTTGQVGLCDANDSGKEQFRGVVLDTKAAGEPVRVLRQGMVYGFGLSGLNYDAFVYQSDNAGALADTASGTKTVRVGRVTSINDSAKTKVLYVTSDMINNW